MKYKEYLILSYCIGNIQVESLYNNAGLKNNYLHTG